MEQNVSIQKAIKYHNGLRLRKTRLKKLARKVINEDNLPEDLVYTATKCDTATSLGEYLNFLDKGYRSHGISLSEMEKSNAFMLITKKIDELYVNLEKKVFLYPTPNNTECWINVEKETPPLGVEVLTYSPYRDNKIAVDSFLGKDKDEHNKWTSKSKSIKFWCSVHPVFPDESFVCEDNQDYLL